MDERAASNHGKGRQNGKGTNGNWPGRERERGREKGGVGGGREYIGEKHEAAWTKDGEESLNAVNEGRGARRMGAHGQGWNFRDRD